VRRKEGRKNYCEVSLCFYNLFLGNDRDIESNPAFFDDDKKEQ